MGLIDTVFNIENKVVIITGASSGLGAAFARALSGAGAVVVLAARRADRLEKISNELTKSGGRVHAISCDVSREADVKRLVAETIDTFARIDVLVNNAGISNTDSAEFESAPDFQRVLQVNVLGAFMCARACAVEMFKHGSGSIVNVASILGVVGCGSIPQAAYAASKGAVVNMTRELAAQWARRGIRVNALAPGWFPSEMTGALFEDEDGSQFIRKRTPMGRGGSPGELFGALLLLASDAGSYMTGQTVIVDGGWTIV